jgi:hypothetical protein
MTSWDHSIKRQNSRHEVNQLQIFQTSHLLGNPCCFLVPAAMSNNGPQPMEVESQEKLMKNEDFSPE